ncbi:MAG TPA: Hsp20/alpha crystallin family protein [Thermodesulfobacteriota bacterium]
MGTLVRMDPFREFSAIQRQMSRLFDEVFGRGGGAALQDLSTASAFTPPVDLWEAPDAYYLRAEVPGVTKDDLQIEVSDGALVIRGERKVGDRLKSEQWLRQEGAYGTFYRAVTLPGAIDVEKIQARVQHGVLEVIVPKAEEARTRVIPIAA